MLMFWNSKTYGDQAGQDIREGFSPADNSDAQDGDEQTRIASEDVSHESRMWGESEEADFKLAPKYGLPGEDLENVWDNAQSPKENP